MSAWEIFIIWIVNYCLKIYNFIKCFDFLLYKQCFQFNVQNLEFKTLSFYNIDFFFKNLAVFISYQIFDLKYDDIINFK